MLSFLTKQDMMHHVHLLGLLAIPIIGLEPAVSLTAALAGLIGVIRWKKKGEWVFWSLIILSILEVLALVHWILLFFGVSSPLSGLALFELDFYYLLAVLAPIPLIILFFGWVPKLLLKPQNEKEETFTQKWTKWDRALLIFSIALAFFAVYYPLSGGINPHNLLLGYDFNIYLNSAQSILTNPLQAFSTFGGDRPIVYLLIFLVHAVSTLDLYDVLMILPLIFLPLLVVLSGLLGWEMYQRADVASWFSFFTASGVFMVETVYGYFISNIIGLCLIFLSLALLFKYLRVSGWTALGASIVTGLLAYFSHPLTLELYAGGLAAMWFIQLLKKGGSRRILKVVPFLLATLALFGTLNWYLEGNRSLLNPYYILSSSAGVLLSLDFLRGGYASNLILLSLAAIGLLRIRYESLSSLYLGVLYAVSGVCFLLLDDVFRFRLFIALPLGLVAAMGLVDILGTVKSIKLRYAVTSFVILFFTVYLLRSMANLI